MTNLTQEQYKDEGGHDIEAAKVDVLAPYQHVIDGFYRWTCGRCGQEHADRSCGWPISGQLMACRTANEGGAGGGEHVKGCGAMNLLVRTNCIEIDKALAGMWRTPERDRELERLNGIVEMNERKVLDIKQRLSSLVQIAISNWRLPVEDQRVEPASVAAVDPAEGIATE